MVVASLLVVYPIASFAMSTLLLINLPAGTSRSARRVLAMLAALSFSMMMGARPLDPDASNDIEVYYGIYEELAAGHLEALAAFGSGLEVALPLLFYLWSLVLPPLSVSGITFCVAFTSAFLLLIWVERTFYSGGGSRAPTLMGACLLLVNLYFATQLARQFMALIVLLYAFSAATEKRRWLYVALAATFHLTAVPFYLLYRLAQRGPVGWIVIVVLAMLVRLFFWQMVAAFDIVPAAVADKLIYYLDNTQEFTEADITSLRMTGLLGGLSLVALTASRFSTTPQMRAWLLVPWLTAIVHLILLPIPLASLRTTLMIHSVVPGLIAYQMFSQRSSAMLPAVLNGLFLYKFVSFATAPQSGNLLTTVAMLQEFFLSACLVQPFPRRRRREA